MKVYRFSEEKNDANTSCSSIPITATYRKYTNFQYVRGPHPKLFESVDKPEDKEHPLGVIREEKYYHGL